MKARPKKKCGELHVDRSPANPGFRDRPSPWCGGGLGKELDKSRESGLEPGQQSLGPGC